MANEKRILVVDDEKDMVAMLEMALEAHHYQVLTAFDGEQALLLAVAEKPDLIILDIMMPKMNGDQVCRQLRAKEETRSIPIVIVSAKSQESDKLRAKESGADEYIIKPFAMSELLQKISWLLQSRA